MRSSRLNLRPAFSLIEMVLAIAIAMLLLAALYVTLSTYMSTSKVGREVTHESALARNLLTRIGDDISGQVGAYDPRGHPEREESEGETTPSASASSAGTSNSSSSGTTSGSSSGMMSGTTTTTTNNSAVLFNFGVSGDPVTLSLSTSRAQKPRPLTTGVVATEDVSSDLRCVMYWIVMNGSEPAGLARYEVKRATAEEIDFSPSNLPEQNKHIIAPEVKSILFEYWDGTAWQTTWDGAAQASEDGIPLGPPAAIRVSITFRRSATDSSDGPTYQNVFALPTGNNFPQKAMTP